jgi:hypothetical protein
MGHRCRPGLACTRCTSHRTAPLWAEHKTPCDLEDLGRPTLGLSARLQGTAYLFTCVSLLLQMWVLLHLIS